MTVTGTRAARPIEEVPQTVQVIERDEIERQLILSSSPSEAIARLVPGYSATTQTISSASENFRGRDALVLLDGVPLNTPLRDVSRILALLDLNAVDRIETVAGASSLYGAGATGGTINIITRRPTEGPPQFTINSALRFFPANLGRSLAPELSLGVTGRSKTGLDYVIVGSGRHSGRTYDGLGRELPSDALLGQGGADRTNSGNLFAKFGYDFDAARRFEVSAMVVRLNQDPDFLTLYSPPRARPDFNTPYPGRSIREASQSFSARYTDTDFALGSLSVVGYYNEIEKRFNYTQFSFPYNSVVYYSGNPTVPTSTANQTTLYSTRYGLNLTIDTPLDRLLSGARFTWGGDVIHERTRQELLTGENVFTPLEQTTLAAFGLLQVPVGPRLTLRGGLRYEHFALSVDGFVRPAAYTGVTARNAAGFSPFVLPALRVTGGDFNYDAITGNAGATFRITERAELYGGYSQGFALPDVGSFTRRAGLSTAFACPVARPNCLPAGASVGYANIGPEAQIVNSYELGLRRRGADANAGIVGFISTSDQGVTFDPLTNRISQQKEMIWGAELNGDVKLTQRFTLAGLLAYREGRYDSDGDGRLDSFLPNNRIATPLRAVLSGIWQFEEGTMLRVEAVGFTGRNQRIDRSGTRYKIEDGGTINLAVSTPVLGGQAYASIDNLFDAGYQNPTATSVRNLPVEAFGRTVTVGYRKTF
ncbi:TonB-dependent receptor [Paracraurococcus lichenis]|uniref:TonB-dependent receptor n=1 Tax=Paracraurococcus lichenis TaxID=3064888 RepID=A0ABT9E8T8_9PROT|nr:TonB-dependent receptor [Paracraurococcus sp. LOR1-02]MDO9712514.1 TonB-dependent receptor [Paracraurococcus sp. LOR1-02]